MVARPIVVLNNFQEGFDLGIIQIKKGHLKGENKMSKFRKYITRMAMNLFGCNYETPVIKFGLLPFTHLKSSSYREGTLKRTNLH